MSARARAPALVALRHHDVEHRVDRYWRLVAEACGGGGALHLHLLVARAHPEGVVQHGVSHRVDVGVRWECSEQRFWNDAVSSLKMTPI
eukprot:5604401-Prymnesium_polylepis.1